jgi:hypothetical protein
LERRTVFYLYQKPGESWTLVGTFETMAQLYGALIATDPGIPFAWTDRELEPGSRILS